MAMVPSVPYFDNFLAILTCCSDIVKTVETIKMKLTKSQLAMFKQTCFDLIFESSVRFNGQLVVTLFLVKSKIIEVTILVLIHIRL